MKVLNNRGDLWEFTGKHVISRGYHGDTTDAITITHPSWRMGLDIGWNFSRTKMDSLGATVKFKPRLRPSNVELQFEVGSTDNINFQQISSLHLRKLWEFPNQRWVCLRIQGKQKQNLMADYHFPMENRNFGTHPTKPILEWSSQ